MSPLKALLSIIPITNRLGNCPRNKFSWLAILLPLGTEKTLVSTRLTGYLAVIRSKPLMWSNWTEGSTLTLRTKRDTSSIFTWPSPMRLKESLLRARRILMSTPFSISRSWKHRSKWGLPMRVTWLLPIVQYCRFLNPWFDDLSSKCPALSLYHNAADKYDSLAAGP